MYVNKVRAPTRSLKNEKKDISKSKPSCILGPAAYGTDFRFNDILDYYGDSFSNNQGNNDIFKKAMSYASV